MYNSLLSVIKEFSTRNAIVIGEQSINYSQLGERINAISDCIINNSNEKDNIGIYACQEFDVYASIFACWACGRTMIPLNPDNPQSRNQSIIEQANISLVIIPKEISDISFTVNSVVSTKLKSSNLKQEPYNILDNDIAYILFTSGSTGAPKGVPISFANIKSFIDGFYALGYKINEEDRVLQMFELTFDLSVMSYIIPLLKGACIYPVEDGEIKYMGVYEILEDNEITFSLMVPSILSYLRPYFRDIDLPKLKFSLFCGEAFYESIAKEWQECIPNAQLWNVYGPTEATIFCMAYKVEKENITYNGVLSIGKQMDKVNVNIFDDNNNIVPKGGMGELCLSGGQISPGYYKNQEKNQEAFFVHDNLRYYRTGDLCFVDKSDNYMYSGRMDTQIQVQGFRVELSEIEFHARDLTKLTNIAAVPKTNSIGNVEIYLYMENYSGNLDDLKNALRDKLPSYMIPTNIINLKNMPHNVNGKIDRKILKQRID